MSTNLQQRTPVTKQQLRDLSRLLAPEHNRWLHLGCQMRVPIEKLKRIEKEIRHQSPDQCFLGVLKMFFSKKPGDRKWHYIFEALEDVNKRRLVKELERDYHGGDIVSDDVDIATLSTLLKDVVPDWYMFGQSLEIPTSELKALRDEKGSDQYFSQMMDEWMEGEHATFETLIEALEHVGNGRLAREVKERYLTSTQGELDDILHNASIHNKDHVKDYSGILKSALKEGHVKVKWTKQSVSGPPGSGKSSFMKLLLNEPPPDCHHSTSIVAVPEVRMVTTTPLKVDDVTQSLIKVDIDLLKEMLAETIKKGVKPHSSLTVQSDKDGCSDHSSSDEAQDIEQQEKVSSVENVSQLQVSNATKDILLMLQSPGMNKSAPLLESHWIYAIDSGGQAAFLDIAPVILRYNSVNILTHKLNENLEDASQFYYCVEGQRIGNPVERQITNLQLIETSFRSLTSVNPPNLPGIPCSIKEPHSLVLGTFYDKISDSGESLDDKNIKLLSTLKQYGNALIVHRVSGNKVIFPVNTIAKDENRQTIAEEIRREICRSYIEAEIPVRWFLFQLDLEEYQVTSKSSVISKPDCISIGKAIEMDEVDVNAALMYYHDLTIYLYFPEVLPNVVFLNPKPLLDKLSLLISISFADAVDQLKTTLDIQVYRSTHEKLKTQGIFSQDLLTESLLQGFSEDFSPKMFLDLMEYLFILSPLSESGEYFLPCVLPTTINLESLRKPFIKNVDPLILTWNEKPLPQGLFPALVVNLLSRQCSPKFLLSTNKPQYRNAIHLACTNLGGSVLLVDAIYWLEVLYTCPHNECHHIREVIREGVSAVVDKFHYLDSLKYPEECFHCSICNTTEHLCHLSEDKPILICCKDDTTDPVHINRTRQQPWFKLVGEEKASFPHKVDEVPRHETIITPHTNLGKRKSERVDSNEDIPYHKQQAYDHSTSSDEDSKSSSKGKEPAGGRYYTKKGKLKRRHKELKGHKRQRSEDSNSDGHQSSSKRLSDTTPVSCDKAVRALVQCTDIIVESTIDPIVLARKLYSKEVISEDVYKRVKDKSSRDTNEERLETILDDIRDRVKYDAGILTKFVDILREKLNRNDLADEIMSYTN